ncbi:uncharacterized protein DS421_10g304670 [Arachis hypogaea]|nr:uncharacterized protein DS421_10g304670 [Arachis hypogaea]
MVTTNYNQQFFCVFVGWIPRIYTSSEEVAEQLHDYGDGGWMEFPTLDNAEEAWALFQGNGNAKKGRKMIAKGKAPAGLQPPERRQMERIALKALHLRFEEDRRHTTPHPRPNQLVPHKPTRNPLIIVSMTRLLSKTCNKLDIPKPAYCIILENTSNGGQNFRHLVSIVLPGESEALVVTSRVASEPHISLEDSSARNWRHRCQWLLAILSVKMVQMLCHSTANHLSVLDHVGIESSDSFASITMPNTREFETRYSHSIPESYSEYHRQGLYFLDSQECCQLILAYTMKTLIKESKRYALDLR